MNKIFIMFGHEFTGTECMPCRLHTLGSILGSTEAQKINQTKFF